MILFPNCKINLGLRITGKRTDGYHDIETVFYPLGLKDALELNTGAKYAHQDLNLTLCGTVVPGDPHTNLCHKAWQLIKNDFPDIGGAGMHLLKAIPIGAGLGGGSSDAAHTLLLLNREFGLGLSKEQLIAYALQLGSDCPFFILNTPCFATGRGELMQEIGIDLSAYHFVLVNPKIHISTAWAFGKIIVNPVREDRRPMQEIVVHPPEQWEGNGLVNDFETPVFEEYPSLKTIKEELYAAGAAYASLTGSGSCLFGIFPSGKEPRFGKWPDQYTVYQLNHSR